MQVCFLNFGDRVENWLTFNEPLTFVNLGYSVGVHAPGRYVTAFDDYIIAAPTFHTRLSPVSSF